MFCGVLSKFTEALDDMKMLIFLQTLHCGFKKIEGNGPYKWHDKLFVEEILFYLKNEEVFS